MENKKGPIRRPVIINGPRPKTAGARPVKPTAKTDNPVKEQPKAAPAPEVKPNPAPAAATAASPSPTPAPASTPSASSATTSTAAPTPAAPASAAPTQPTAPVASAPVSPAAPSNTSTVSSTSTSTSATASSVSATASTSAAAPEKTEVKSKVADSKKNTSSKQKPAKKEKTESKSDPAKAILIVLCLLLTGATGFLLYDKFSNTAKLTQQLEEAQESTITLKSDIESKIAEISRLQDSIKLVIAEKQALGLELSEERAKLAELESLKSQIQSKQMTINSLNKKLSKYNKQYETVQANVGALLAENQRLVSEKVKLEEIILAKDDTIKSIAAVQAQLAEKVTTASVLRAQNIGVTVYNSGGKEMKGTPKAMMVGNIKASMNLSENKIKEHGPMDVYLRIIEPSGTPLFTGDKSFTVDGKKTFYTDKQTIEFDNTKQRITFVYNKGSRYIPGKYTIEFYADGKKIGDSQFTLGR